MVFLFRLANGLFVFIAIAAMAQADDNVPPLSSPPGMSYGGKRSRRQNSKDAVKADLKGIKGQCILQKGPNNLVAAPCVDLVLILQDIGGNEILRTRTDSKGAFEFTPDADKGDKFLFGAGSRLYEVASPKDPVTRGEIVNLQVKIR